MLLTLKAVFSRTTRFLVLATSLVCSSTWGMRPAGAFSGDTLEQVKKRDYVLCGVAEDVAGFSTIDDKGNWTGLDADFCRAVAAALLGSKDKVKFRPLNHGDRFKALQANEIDLLARATSWTLSRDTELGLRFAGILYFDGQGFLVRRNLAISSLLELSGASICVLAGGSGERALSDHFRVRQMKYDAVVSKNWDELVQAYSADRCTLLSGDVTQLALERSRLSDPNDHAILPDVVTKEPRGPAVAEGDEQWFALVRWVLFALVGAEELGLTSANVDEAQASTVNEVQNFLGTGQQSGQGIGLPQGWAYQVVKQVGNYGELFDRNLGMRSALKIERGPNDIWARGGLMYAPPFR